VPVGGPPTPKGAKGAHTPPGPPPNPGPILAAVQADLSRLDAIQAYDRDKVALADSQQRVSLAEAELQFALQAQYLAQSAESEAASQASAATARLRDMALAAYMGLGYLTPSGGSPLPGEGATGAVAVLGNLTGTAAVDAEEMLRLVAQRELQGVADTAQQLRQADKATVTAGEAVAGFRATLVSAQASLVASQKNLVLASKAALTPGSTAGSDELTSDADPASSSASPSSPPSPTILGPSILTATELAQWFASTGNKANTTVPIAQLAADYEAAGKQTGVRADIAFAQSIVETGYFSFPSYGQVTPEDNNFAGIGACDSCAHGWRFANAQTGVGAQMELLEAYASPSAVPTPLLGKNIGVGGCCSTWMSLGGTWASSLTYGISIMTIYNQMLTWAIPQRLQEAGLISPSPAAASNPATGKLSASRLRA
jgi:Mannosyl-glycoprotein endo-beta-N-acetylglucosaminidase